MARLDGKVAIVTGGARGIGLAVAQRFVAEGAAVLIGGGEGGTAEGAAVMIADVEDEAGRAAARSLGEATCRFMRTDVGDAGDARKLVAETCAAFGKLDVLINNAGIIHAADFLELQEADFERVLR